MLNPYIGYFRAYIHNALFPSLGHSKLGIGFLCIGLCIGVAVRAGMLGLVDYRVDAGDAIGYLSGAHNLLEHQVYSLDENDAPAPSFYKPPLYSFFIALVAAVFGNSMLSVQLAQIVLSLMTALLITRITAHCAPKAAPWVFGLMMLSPYEAVYAGAVLSETLTTLLLVAAAYAILTLDGMKRWVLGGMFLGLCVLTRDVYSPMVILVAAFWIGIGQGRRLDRCIDATVFILSFCLVVLPWTVRNYLVAEQFVLVTKGRLGYGLWVGAWATNVDFTKTDAAGKPRVYPPEAFRTQAEKDLVAIAVSIAASQGSSSAEPIFQSLATQRIRDEPIAVLGRYLVRAPRLWLGTRFDTFQLNATWFPRDSFAWTAVKIALWGLNFLLMCLGIAGMVVAWRQRDSVLILLLPIAFTAVIYLPFVYEIRFSQPVYPFILVFVGIAAVWLSRKRLATRKEPGRINGEVQ